MKPETKNWWIKAFVSAGFVGYCPVASGTLGTMVGVLLYLAVRHFFWLQVALILALFFLGSILSSKAEQLFKERDSHRIVVDEVMGFLITMFGMGRVDWPILVVAFLLNRACDIWKPFPIRKLEDLPGGWGIMLDDFGAGIYSNMILRVILAIF